MSRSVIGQIAALRKLTVGELREKWLELYGEASRSRNRDFLFRRLAWRVQEIAHGGLSAAAHAKIDELAPEGFRRARTPHEPPDAPAGAPPPKPTKIRDINTPTVGTVLTRRYKGREIRVVTLDDGFEYDGRVYRSLSAIAKAVTGQHWNGKLFFGLTKRKRR